MGALWLPVLLSVLPIREASAHERLFIVPWCRGGIPGHGCAITYEGYTFHAGRAYWIVASWPLADGSTRYRFIDDYRQTRYFDVRGFRHNAAGVMLRPLPGWNAQGTRPELTVWGDAGLVRAYQGFVSVLASGFPLVQLVGCALLGGFYWLALVGSRVLRGGFHINPGLSRPDCSGCSADPHLWPLAVSRGWR